MHHMTFELFDAVHRFLADNVLENLGAAAKSSADMVASCAEAYLEELQMLGRLHHPLWPEVDQISWTK